MNIKGGRRRVLPQFRRVYEDEWLGIWIITPFSLIFLVWLLWLADESSRVCYEMRRGGWSYRPMNCCCCIQVDFHWTITLFVGQLNTVRVLVVVLVRRITSSLPRHRIESAAKTTIRRMQIRESRPNYGSNMSPRINFIALVLLWGSKVLTGHSGKSLWIFANRVKYKGKLLLKFSFILGRERRLRKTFAHYPPSHLNCRLDPLI